MNLIREVLSYPFPMRALAGDMMISLCASLLGVSLVLRRYSMVGDELSHVPFGALSIALTMDWSPLRISILVVMLAAFFLFRITKNSRIKSDAAIALISASALALGIIVTSLTTGMTTNVSSYMFRNILAMSREDIRLSMVLSLMVLGLFVMYYNRISTVTFDENFTKATGVNVGRCNIIIAVLTAVIIILGIGMMKVMLVSSLVIFPCLSSVRVFRSFGGVMVSSGILSLACFFADMVTSYQFSIPAGASVMVVDLYAFPLFVAWQSLGRLKSRCLRLAVLPAGCFTGRLSPAFQ